MVVITHDPRDVDALAQAVVTLDAGHVVGSRDCARRSTVAERAAVAAPL
jgi:ABC-type thiamine transport system ATPase subunit